jgi:hypothetical protein
LPREGQEKVEPASPHFLLFPNFTLRIPYFEYLFILGVFWDFADRKCESQYILPEIDRGNILTAMPVSYTFSEEVVDDL